MTSNPLKWHGGKTYLAKKIIELMPARAKNPNAPANDDPGWLHYVEGYAGGLAVLLEQDPEGISEVVNDLNGDLINFWRVIGNDVMFDRFKRMCEATPCGEPFYEDAVESLKTSSDAVERAHAFFVRNRQSRQALGKCFSTIARNRTRRGMNELPSAWLTAIEGLPEIHDRLKRVVVLNDTALKIIKQQDGPRTFFYLDPPYMHETRVTTSDYECEMTRDDHIELLHLLGSIQGKFILSGYPSQLYDQHAGFYGWRHVDIEIDNKASSKATKEMKIERLWMNY